MISVEINNNKQPYLDKYRIAKVGKGYWIDVNRQKTNGASSYLYWEWLRLSQRFKSEKEAREFLDSMLSESETVYVKRSR